MAAVWDTGSRVEVFEWVFRFSWRLFAGYLWDLDDLRIDVSAQLIKIRGGSGRRGRQKPLSRGELLDGGRDGCLFAVGMSGRFAVAAAGMGDKAPYLVVKLAGYAVAAAEVGGPVVSGWECRVDRLRHYARPA